MFPVAALAASSSLSFTAHSLNLNPGDTVGLVAVDAEGDVYEAGNVLDSSGNPRVQVTKTDPNGHLQMVGSYQFGSGEKAMAITVDSQGSVIVAGTGYEADFPDAHVYGPATTLPVVFVAKLDPQLAGITAAAVIGGNRPIEGSAPYTTSAGALTVDAAGNIYVGGSASVMDLPVTSGAYQTSNGMGFLAEFSSGLDRLVFATYYTLGLTSLVVDPTGAIVAACSTNRLTSYTQVVAFAPGGGSVLWTDRLGGVMNGNVTTSALAVDGSGNVVLVSNAYGSQTSAGALQSCPSPAGGGFVTKLASANGAALFATNFGCGGIVNSVALDASGAIWITGTADPSSLPVTPSTPGGPTYLAAIAPDGSSVEALYTGGAGMFGQALTLTPAGSPVVLGSGILMVPNSSGGPSLLGVGNSAGSAASAVIAPTELVSFYGTGLGPAAPLNAQVVGGVVQNTLGGYQLLFSGVAAPLLYLGANQINAVVPNEVWGENLVPVTLVTPTGTFPLADLYVRPSEPEIFHDPVSGYVVAINQDGTLNSGTNPAHAGEVVSVWGTGSGVPVYGVFPVDGIVVPLSGGIVGQPSLPFSVIAGYLNYGAESLEVDYAGASPGEVFGLLQVNFWIPPSLPSGGVTNGYLPLNLQIGDAMSARVYIYVAP